jgi:hypothetical protein
VLLTRTLWTNLIVAYKIAEVKVNTVLKTIESVDNLRKTYFTEDVCVLCSIAFVSTVMTYSDHCERYKSCFFCWQILKIVIGENRYSLLYGVCRPSSDLSLLDLTLVRLGRHNNIFMHSKVVEKFGEKPNIRSNDLDLETTNLNLLSNIFS